jgi:hypothetical protein
LRTNKTNWRPRCYQDTNPGGIDHVANKQMFVSPFWNWDGARYVSTGKKETETRYIHSTVDDNKFVDSGYKEYLEKLVGWQREAWLHGSWEFMAGAFFSNFHEDIHCYPNAVTTLNERAITRWFAGLDYGYSHPNAFLLCCEDESGNIFCVGEYTASNTLIEEHAANIKDLCALHNLDVGELEFIAAGKDCFRVDKDGSTVATEYSERGIMLTATHIDRVNAWSQMAEVMGDIQHQIKPRFFVHRNCENLIVQIQSAQSDPKKPNDILKMNASPEDGQGGDDVLEACFVAGTMVIANGKEIPIEKIKAGDKVLTREGWKKVLSAGKTGFKKIYEAQFSHGRNLIGSGNHPIWTQRGWVRLDGLRNDDIVSVCLNPKQLYSTEENSGVIRNQNAHTCETIISPVKLNRLVKVFRFIRKFINPIMELIKFLPGSISTTETETRSTTDRKTLNAFWSKTTSRNMTPRKEKRGCENTPNQSGHLPPHGITPKRPAIFQKQITQHRSENHLKRKSSNASFAEKILKFIRRTNWLNFATLIAKSRSKEKTNGIGKRQIAPFAERNSSDTNTQTKKLKLVPANVEGVYAVGQREVFNLEVEDCHEYFAKGVLVHNCRNAIVMAYSSLLSSATAVKMGGYESLSESREFNEVIDVEEIIRQAEDIDFAKRMV